MLESSFEIGTEMTMEAMPERALSVFGRPKMKG